jgi:hypothetical protein
MAAPVIAGAANHMLYRKLQGFHPSGGNMIRTFALIALLLASPVYAGEEVIPSNIAGIWATNNSILREGLLFEGEGLYLDSDGVGVVIGGPPPIGVRITATYDQSTNVISYQMTEDGKITGQGSLVYDPARKVIVITKDSELHKRFDRVSTSIRKSLGLEPKSQ